MAHSSHVPCVHTGFKPPASVKPSNSDPPPSAGPLGPGLPSQNIPTWACECGLKTNLMVVSVSGWRAGSLPGVPALAPRMITRSRTTRLSYTGYSPTRGSTTTSPGPLPAAHPSTWALVFEASIASRSEHLVLWFDRSLMLSESSAGWSPPLTNVADSACSSTVIVAPEATAGTLTANARAMPSVTPAWRTATTCFPGPPVSQPPARCICSPLRLSPFERVTAPAPIRRLPPAQHLQRSLAEARGAISHHAAGLADASLSQATTPTRRPRRVKAHGVRPRIDLAGAWRSSPTRCRRRWTKRPGRSTCQVAAQIKAASEQISANSDVAIVMRRSRADAHRSSSPWGDVVADLTEIQVAVSPYRAAEWPAVAAPGVMIPASQDGNMRRPRRRWAGTPQTQPATPDSGGRGPASGIGRRGCPRELMGAFAGALSNAHAARAGGARSQPRARRDTAPSFGQPDRPRRDRPTNATGPKVPLKPRRGR